MENFKNVNIFLKRKSTSVKILIIVTLVLYSCNDQSRNNDKGKASDGAYISISQGDDLFRIDSVTFRLNGDIPFSNIGMKYAKVLADEKGNFNIHYKDKNIDSLKHLNIYIYGSYDDDSKYRENLFNYLIADRDSIKITTKKAKTGLVLDFMGRGEEKYKCKWTLGQVGLDKNLDQIRDKQYTYRHLDRVSRFKRNAALADSIIDLQMDILKRYKNQLKPSTYQVIKADAIGGTNRWLKVLWTQRENYKAQVELAKLMIEEAEKLHLNQEAMAASPDFVFYMNCVAIARLINNHPTDQSYSMQEIQVHKIKELCEILINNYSGILREKLLLYNLQNSGVQDTDGVDACLRESYTLIKTPYLKSIVDQWYGKKLKGAEAFDFAMENTKGEIVHLSDFKGKVVYLDIWFTGCGGCRKLASKVDKLVYPKFKDNPDIVFVSISLDKDKKRWLRSVESEHYGLKEYVNLYTGGMGLKHPFMEYYDVQGGPTTMLIDREGKMYSSSPPKYNDDDQMTTLIALLEEAIRQGK